MGPRALPSRETEWVNQSPYACDHAAAGNWDAAMRTLQLQIAAVDFSKMKDPFLSLWTAAHTSLPQMHGTPALIMGLESPTAIPGGRSVPLPPVCIQLSMLVGRLKQAYTSFNQNKLDDSLAHFSHILALIPLLRPDAEQIAEVDRIRDESKEYIMGLRLVLEQRSIIKTNPKRGVELASYFTHCSLQPAHSMLALKTAMGLAYKLKNYADAGGFAQRLLEKAPDQKLAQAARTVMAVSQQEATSTNAMQLDYDARNPFVVCGKDLTPIYRGSQFVKCAYCAAFFSPQYKEKKCNVCDIAVIGGTAHGLFKSPTFA